MKKLLALALVALLVSFTPVQAITSYTVNACLPQPLTGDPTSLNTWGILLNQGSSVTDGLVAGVTSINVSGSSNVVLTFNCGFPDQTDAAHFTFTGALTGAVTVLWPNGRDRVFTVTNNTTGAFVLSLGVNNGSGSAAGITQAISQGTTFPYYSDGTNIKPNLTLTNLSTSIPGYISNLTLSNDSGTPNTVIDVTAGVAEDSTNAVMMVLPTPLVLNFANTGALGLDIGSQTANTWYAIFLIDGTFGTSVIATKEIAAPPVPSLPAGYSYSRYIGSVLSNNSNQIQPFVQYGQKFFWGTSSNLSAINDFGVAPPAGLGLVFNISIPPGGVVYPMATLVMEDSVSSFPGTPIIIGNGSNIPLTSNSVITAYAGPVSPHTTSITFDQLPSTNGKISISAASATCVLTWYTLGWIDPHVAAVW